MPEKKSVIHSLNVIFGYASADVRISFVESEGIWSKKITIEVEDEEINRNIRLFVSIAILLFLLLGVAAGLYITDSMLSVLDNLQNRPDWVIAVFLGVVLVVVALSALLVMKLLFPRNKQNTKHKISENSEEVILERIKKASDSGLNTLQVEQEVIELATRRKAGHIYVAMFGEVNMGKSSIICTVLPEADVTTSLIAGTTQKITHYKWQSSAGDELILADVPGTQQINASSLSTLARDEALRSHIVVYVCDGDLNRSQFDELRLLAELQKPTIVALNKADIYSQEELDIIQNKLLSQLPSKDTIKLVFISCGREEPVIRVLANGSEETHMRSIPADVTQLTQSIQEIIDTHEATLDQLRDTAVFVLAASYLDKTEAAERDKQANILVEQYTKRAVIGALATVSPGTDIIVQAYLGTSMVKAICEIYHVPVGKFDIDTFLKLVQAQVGKSVPVVLAIAGNGLKAFPGIGTVAGGLVHATAYGLIFDTLGKTLVRTLSNRGEFRPAATARVFQETLSENLERGTMDFIKIVLDARKKETSER